MSEWGEKPILPDDVADLVDLINELDDWIYEREERMTADVAVSILSYAAARIGKKCKPPEWRDVEVALFINRMVKFGLDIDK